jgi:hypothetical protein
MEGSMNLDDREIKAAVSDYLGGGESSSHGLSNFKKLTEIYIYNFPRAAYRKDLDTCSGFYIYMVERLESVIKNFPLGEDIKFKTWFNYVLRNQFSHFMRFQKKESLYELNIDDYENKTAFDVFETESFDYSFLEDCMKGLDNAERLTLKFFYMPSSLTPEDIISSSDAFGLSISDILSVQAGLIKARADESSRARHAVMKINYINKVLRDLKHRLRSISLAGSQQGRAPAVPLIDRIARYEAAKARRIREMESPDRRLFAVFAPLFDNAVRAKRSLNGSKKKLKMMILYKMNARKTGRGLS